MVFCNTNKELKSDEKYRHNPYFNRWFSAIRLALLVYPDSISHNPYFNRWFSAIRKKARN